MPYIHFTEEQKLRASEVDLVEFLRHQGEKLIRSGPEYRLASDHSVTVRGNGWYDHAVKEGGDPRCSFHYTGTSNRLYVFEAPIDLMCRFGGLRQDRSLHRGVCHSRTGRPGADKCAVRI